MSKPASGASLDTGNALYSHLTAAGSAVWGMLEGSGSTSADSSGNGHGLTLDSSATWTTIAGEAAVACAGTTGQAMAVASPPSLAGTSSWSFAWRAKQTSSGNSGMVAGEENNPGLGFIWMRGTVFLEFSTASTFYVYSISDFTADHDYLIAYDQAAAQIHLYKDGTEDASSPVSVSGNNAAWIVRSLGSGYDGAGSFSLVGTMSYAYLMSGYAASSTDASNLHTDPYSIFSAGGTAYHLAGGTGTFAETGGSASLLDKRPLVGGTGTFAETGDAAGLLRGRKLAAAAGTFVETGGAAGLLDKRLIVASAGAFVLSGDAAGLVYSGASPSLAGGTGVFVETGGSSALLSRRLLVSAAGPFVETGDAAGLLRGRKLAGGTGVFVETAGTAGFVRSYLETGGTGAFVLSGDAAGLVYSGAPANIVSPQALLMGM